jgi:ABC-type multidrug transport system ATPase subunit
MQPTGGSVSVAGRVSALLELGAGFNPEFTGRDNVLFQGQVQGLSREEMERRLPEIEDFAEIGEFFDQPVKTYSSGMFVRLGFAAAVHVDPDILIIDEALAVGDAKFQHKCFEYLGELRTRAKTILFVTHNTGFVTAYAERALLLESGSLLQIGEPALIVDRYHELLFGNGKGFRKSPAKPRIESDRSSIAAAEGKPSEFLARTSTEEACHTRRSYNPNETRFGNGAAHIIDYGIGSEQDCDAAEIICGSRIVLYIKALFLDNIAAPGVGFSIKTVEGLHVYGTNTMILGIRLRPAARGEVWVFDFSFFLGVSSGNYFLDLAVLEADGTRGGIAVDVRRSVAHILVSSREAQRFDGMVDLNPRFEVLAQPRTSAEAAQPSTIRDEPVEDKGRVAGAMRGLRV